MSKTQKAWTAFSILTLLAVVVVSALAKDQPIDPRTSLIEEGAEYIGTAQCLMCHSEMKEGFLGTKHALTLGNTKLPPSVVGCEMCHGPASLHMENFTNDPGERGIFAFKGDTAEEYGLVCLECHKSTASKLEWAENRHSEESVNCATCHDPHVNAKYGSQLKKPKNELCASCHKGISRQLSNALSSHPVKEGDFSCADCHNPHGDTRSLLKSDGIAETCGACHEYTVQPYLFQHLSEFTDVSGEECLNCHNPHGTSTPNLLRQQGRSLCMSCHTDRVIHNPGITCWTSGCHSRIHGSNDSALFIK